MNLGVLAAVTFLLWLVSLLVRDASVVDIFWGLGFVLVAWVAVFNTDSDSARVWILAGLTSLWGLRLAGYLAWRNLGHGEDYRYRAMRERAGGSFWITSLFLVFWLQAGILWIVSLPIQAGMLSHA